MIRQLEERIRGMASGSKLATPDRMLEVITDWDLYFYKMQIPPAGEEQEFDGIIRARVLSGNISLLAPELPIIK